MDRGRRLSGIGLAPYFLSSIRDAPRRSSSSRSTGEVFSAQFDLSEAFGLSQLRLSLERLRPGARSAPPHSHSLREEGFIVLKGQGLFTIGDHSKRVIEGDVVLIRPGTTSVHALLNTEDVDLEIFSFSSQVDGDEVTYQR
ncbi:MAG: cupin domain-containing protein [Polyangiaceae bacterium]